MSVPHEEQVRILEMRVADLERQVWMMTLDREAEAAASKASKASNTAERLVNHDAQIAETKARLDFFQAKLAEVSSVVPG